MSPAARVLSVALLAAACSGADDAEPAQLTPDTELSAGAGTVFDTTRDAFSRPVGNLDGPGRDEFFLGNAIFSRSWVTAPASVSDFDGLGPLFNAGNCSSCHFKDGRGRPPTKPDEDFVSILVRLSVPGAGPHGEPIPDPVYGEQLQQDAVHGVAKEGKPRVTYVERAGAYADGEAYSLRVPTYTIEELGYGALAPGVMLSPRTAPSIVGMGLLEAIPAATLEALADPDDRDRDGISGRANHVWDPIAQRATIGRFGWKANAATIPQQDAAAFVNDMGITSTVFAAEICSGAQSACAAAPTGPFPQLREDLRAQVDFYVRTLGVPARRKPMADAVRRGRAMFDAARCSTCHLPTIRTGDAFEIPELARQELHPFSDLLLHDMGPDLADGRPDFEASGVEWRTPPLWGIGLVEHVNRHTFFLHDGRARGFAEAILWHGGEAAAARDAFVAMPKTDRDALVAFLGSL
ncbi:MAG: thiol oxidoreductase [Labilithrix sp.]|nr:thiol oxidoreductase [Labilithrix sp.]MCW5815540.1 thiol oxidoreductase [Labilithrix sp.]